MKYQIEIVETLSRIVEVEAESQGEAYELVESDYRHQGIVLDASDFVGYEIMSAD